MTPQQIKALFQRVMSIAQANADLDSDDVLEELEEYDRERKAKKQAPKRE